MEFCAQMRYLQSFSCFWCGLSESTRHAQSPVFCLVVFKVLVYLMLCCCCCGAGVGKSCLLLQFTDKRFQPVHDLTIGQCVLCVIIICFFIVLLSLRKKRATIDLCAQHTTQVLSLARAWSPSTTGKSSCRSGTRCVLCSLYSSYLILFIYLNHNSVSFLVGLFIGAVYSLVLPLHLHMHTHTCTRAGRAGVVPLNHAILLPRRGGGAARLWYH